MICIIINLLIGGSSSTNGSFTKSNDSSATVVVVVGLVLSTSLVVGGVGAVSGVGAGGLFLLQRVKSKILPACQKYKVSIKEYQKGVVQISISSHKRFYFSRTDLLEEVDS